MKPNPTILAIMGSVRAGRLCPQITDWVLEEGRAHTPHQYEVVDLLSWPLPMGDEPSIPATGRYAQTHTQMWSNKIAAADGLLFITPQYNWGYPAVLKNAIDHLYAEWRGKPALLITYGGHGGTKCAEQLKQIAAAVKLRPAPHSPALDLPDEVIREGAPLSPSRDFARHVVTLHAAFDELTGLLERAQQED